MVRGAIERMEEELQDWGLLGITDGWLRGGAVHIWLRMVSNTMAWFHTGLVGYWWYMDVAGNRESHNRPDAGSGCFRTTQLE